MTAEPRLFVPEVVQTSAMDCGPAALKAVLEGHGFRASYGRLREACQTDVDGTSIDAVEEVALQLGLNAEQIIIPGDHVTLPSAEALPAIAVTVLPNGNTHFLVIWRKMGRFIQLMDPANGRRWVTERALQSELYQHQMALPVEMWSEWAHDDGFLDPLTERIERLGLSDSAARSIANRAADTDDWRVLAGADAAVRMLASVVKAEGLVPGTETEAVLRELIEAIKSDPDKATAIVPSLFWSALPLPDNPDALLFKGAVMVRIQGAWREADDLDARYTDEDGAQAPKLSAELRAAISKDERQPLRVIWEELRQDGLLAPLLLIGALFISALTVLVEALLLRGIIDLGQMVGQQSDRLTFIIAIIGFFTALMFLEYPIAVIVQRMGRLLEMRLRIRFLEKIPNLSDRYFHSRLTSDMVQRAHDMRQLRGLPALGVQIVRVFFQLTLTTLGVILLDPVSVVLALIATAVMIGISLAAQPVLMEQDLRVRTHTGALSRFFLDAMVGLVPLRTHGAERPFRREYEGLLVEWMRALLNLFRVDVLMLALTAFVGWFFTVLILFSYIGRGGEASGVLLLFYWTLSIPTLGQTLSELVQQYPIQRNRLLRLLEPLDATDEDKATAYDRMAENATQPLDMPTDPAAVALHLSHIHVQAGGHRILEDVSLTINPGEQVAIVGPSGAGKSSLVGLLLGWHTPTHGAIWIDGDLLNGDRLRGLRRETAWIDPDVRLWNRSLYDNLVYGSAPNGQSPATSPMDAIDRANLFNVLKRLPRGLQTELGEAGGLVSGGEGQRVRLARGMLRSGVRLVIMDEPFRGLDRPQRRDLMRRVRDYWQGATLISITHDVTETRDYPRVIVIEDGRIVEDGDPAVLLARDSRYRALYDADEAMNSGLWRSGIWRRLWLEDGRLKSRD